jgi:hypothetical protein
MGSAVHLSKRRQAMIRNGVKTVVLYLEDWQKRMIKDFLGVDADTYEVPHEDPVVIKYGPITHKESKRMYFTDWQIREMRDESGVVCEFIELTKEVQPFLKYMVPTSQK